MVQILFSDESKFSISFVNQGPRVWRKRRDTESMLLEVQCEVSTVSDDLCCHVICWCWSTVFSEVHSQHRHLQDILEHFMLPSADKLYGDDDFNFPAGLGTCTCAKATKSWFNDHVLLCLIGQQTRLTWTPSRIRWETPDPTMQMSWRTCALLHLSSATEWLSRCHAALMQ